mmetsp:Transcript_10169/g.29060  ORF Transcript_10169/g.29060 Transcript_10169/m.29060 type:complete len:271 (-) Transcript_10169:687-1499(-)
MAVTPPSPPSLLRGLVLPLIIALQAPGAFGARLQRVGVGGLVQEELVGQLASPEQAAPAAVASPLAVASGAAAATDARSGAEVVAVGSRAALAGASGGKSISAQPGREHFQGGKEEAATSFDAPGFTPVAEATLSTAASAAAEIMSSGADTAFAAPADDAPAWGREREGAQEARPVATANLEPHGAKGSSGGGGGGGASRSRPPTFASKADAAHAGGVPSAAEALSSPRSHAADFWALSGNWTRSGMGESVTSWRPTRYRTAPPNSRYFT